jgi:hypothetical protein
MRVLFKKNEQRKFLDLVIRGLGCISLRGILQFGVDVSYDRLKNYYTERRLLPKTLFDDLCHISKINKEDFGVKYLDDNWGRAKGGKN